MLKSCIRAAALKQLRTDTKGLVSFEYVIVAACIVAGLGAAFNAGTSGLIGAALTGALTTIFAALGS
jgi:hypothetical protein